MIVFAITWLKSLTFFAATVGDSCTPTAHSFFFFPHWWEYLPTKVDVLGECNPVFSFPNDILAVGLAVLDILLRAAGLAAIVSIIIAGVSYITASGNPENTVKARKRIFNSLIGLGIVFAAAGIVAFIGNKLGN